MVHRPAAVREGAAVATHPELQAEQAHVDRAYRRLDQLRADARERLRSVLVYGGFPLSARSVFEQMVSQLEAQHAVHR